MEIQLSKHKNMVSNLQLLVVNKLHLMVLRALEKLRIGCTAAVEENKMDEYRGEGV